MDVIFDCPIKTLRAHSDACSDVITSVPYKDAESHPRPRVTKLGPDDRVDWVIVSKPVLTTAVDDTTFSAFQNIPGKQH